MWRREVAEAALVIFHTAPLGALYLRYRAARLQSQYTSNKLPASSWEVSDQLLQALPSFTSEDLENLAGARSWELYLAWLGSGPGAPAAHLGPAEWLHLGHPPVADTVGTQLSCLSSPASWVAGGGSELHAVTQMSWNSREVKKGSREFV